MKPCVRCRYALDPAKREAELNRLPKPPRVWTRCPSCGLIAPGAATAALGPRVQGLRLFLPDDVAMSHGLALDLDPSHDLAQISCWDANLVSRRLGQVRWSELLRLLRVADPHLEIVVRRKK